MAGVYECHDRDRFEICAIATGPNDFSPMRTRLEQAFDRFHDVSGETDQKIAELIRAEEIDILVNLNGYFGQERTAVFALKPAPIQVNYLGFPGTMGAPFMDYIVADEIVLPKDQQRHFAENVAYLPYTYQPNDRKRAIAELAPTRAECGLPETGVVFCCFNNTHKLTPEFFDVWMRLLDKTPGSVLWVLETTPAVSQNLRREAARRGVAPERIVFAPVIKLPDHSGAVAARGPVPGYAAAQRTHDRERRAVVPRAGGHLSRHDVRRTRSREPAACDRAWGFGHALARGV